MLDSDTKKRIDDARDVLVGKVPDPKSQVEQITLALIYKFMDDMDKISVHLGGKATFFSGEYKKYSWSSIFNPKLSGQDLLNLYGEGLIKMNQNPNIPQLFRDIFKNAYLPYRDPETLKSFLKEINCFKYDHSERLGDAYEYLLSVLGSQGDAGQFRTPRHIIDFMVKVLDPKKNETVLDPACGTAGFLISSYKNIMEQNTKKQYGDMLTPDEKRRLLNNFIGHDISPDMVRISLVNMYLHGFANPKISEYDTLTSEEKWNETADVILANPPFMTPKGGIRPHKKFSVQANRSEVLFVDYIAEHLTKNGRAGIIVPEGIIFQSGKAYKQLRKMLVENYLYAVVSLPAGIFNPYSGVKTSILFLDKTIAKKVDSVLFIKAQNDGFDLGAQRAVIDKNDLPNVYKIIKHFQNNYALGHSLEAGDIAYLEVPKLDISLNGDCSLSFERYRKTDEIIAKFDLKYLGEIADFKRGPFGGSLKKEIFVKEGYKVYEQKHAINNDFNIGDYYIDAKKYKEMKDFAVKPNDLLISCSGTMGKVAIVPHSASEGIINQALLRLTAKDGVVLPVYLKLMLESEPVQSRYFRDTNGVAIQNVASVKTLKEIHIPLPPIEIQKEIIAEIEGYQKIIDGAKQVVENYKPRFVIDPAWKLVELNSVTHKITDGSHFSPQTIPEGYPYITVRDIVGDSINFNYCKFISKKDYLELKKNACQPLKDDILFSKDGTVGKVAHVSFEKEFVVLSSLAIIRPNKNIILPEFLKRVLQSDYFVNKAIENKTGVAIRRIVLKTLKTIKIPLPPMKIQKQIANNIAHEVAIIESTNKIVQVFEQKIKSRIADIWQAN